MCAKVIIGILGGPGAGKSTVAAEFGRLGCAVIDADAIAHELLENEEIKQQIKDAFGGEVFDEAGRVDRAALAEVVFSEKSNVEKINAIIHKPVLARCEGLIAEYNGTEAKAIVLDMPLLAEVGWEKKCDKLVFVACDEQVRTQRLVKKRGFSKKQLKKRENFQILLDIKAQIADYIIDNNSGLAGLAEKVVRIFTIINK